MKRIILALLVVATGTACGTSHVPLSSSYNTEMLYDTIRHVTPSGARVYAIDEGLVRGIMGKDTLQKYLESHGIKVYYVDEFKRKLDSITIDTMPKVHDDYFYDGQ